MTITLSFFSVHASQQNQRIFVRPSRQLLVYSDSFNCLAVFVAQNVWGSSKQSKWLKQCNNRVKNCKRSGCSTQSFYGRGFECWTSSQCKSWTRGCVTKDSYASNSFLLFFFFSDLFSVWRCRCFNLFKTFAFYDHKFIQMP